MIYHHLTRAAAPLLLGLATLFAAPLRGQDFALKTNTLYWGALSPNAAIEAALGPKTTLNLQVVNNPWTWSDDKKLRFWLVQPELRHWLCGKFEGHFVGVHLHGAKFFGNFNDTRRDGWLAGAGISYGYDWILSPHWNLEATIGAGYARLWWDEAACAPCVKQTYPKHKDYFGPTSAGLSFSYIF